MTRALTIGILSAAALAACAGMPPRPGPAAAATVQTRTYTGEQLRRTGRTDVAHALGMLDPSITVIGH